MVTERDLDRLRTRRERVGLSLRALSRAAGVDHAYLSRLERGQAPVSAVQLERLERALIEAALGTVLDRPSLVDVVRELTR